MGGLLSQVEFWHWLIFGLVLAVIEILAPGTFFLWLGIAAGITGLLLLVVPTLTWQLQLVVFAVLSVATVAGWRVYQRRHPTVTDDLTLNRRAEQLVGRVFALEQAIVNGRGTLRVGDSVWRAEGPDLPAGARVRVTGASGAILKVERAEEI
jgi:membrane protein implicated in regulation of membrane protease activity